MSVSEETAALDEGGGGTQVLPAASPVAASLDAGGDMVAATPAAAASAIDAPAERAVASALSSQADTASSIQPVIADPAPAEPVAAAIPPALDPAVALLCAPMSAADPCGPDLDLEGDGDYLNFFAAVEGILPSSFFSLEDGKPFDPATVDIPAQIEAIRPLLGRSRDLRLLVVRARLQILNRDLGGFAVTVAAIAEWLDKHWDAIHPRPQGGSLDSRTTALAGLDAPTVVFPLQYAPLYEARRIGPVTYRAWMIASGEVKQRSGEQKHPTSALTEAMADADPQVLATSRKHVALLKAGLARIRNAFPLQGGSAGLENLSTLVEKMSAFIDPRAAAEEKAAADAAQDGGGEAATKSTAAIKPAGAVPVTLAQAKDALAAVADYYTRLEPSSPTLPLVRQAHQLIGKSFIEVMTILVPTQMEKAAFQIGAEQVFELPLGRLPKLPEMAPANSAGGAAAQSDGASTSQYRVESRSQAIALLDQVQRFFRASEPGSPVPMLCERARALAERDFMAVLRDVLPKAALKAAGADR